MLTEYTVEVTDRRVMGVKSAAAYLDTTKSTIERLIARGVLSKVMIPTLKRVLIPREDLDRLIDAGRCPQAMYGDDSRGE